MARIAGVNIPTQKRVDIALTYIHGIGHVKAAQICEKTGIAPNTRVHKLTEGEISKSVRRLIVTTALRAICAVKFL